MDQGQTPKAAAGLRVAAFAQGLKHPRWLHVLPNGDVLVAEAASEPAKSWSPRALVQNMVQRRSGSIVENANRISLLRDADGDGVAEQTFVFLEGLRQPFGMALIGDQLYVANTDSVVRFPYRTGETRITDKGTKLLDLPVGHHWTRALLASKDGTSSSSRSDRAATSARRAWRSRRAARPFSSSTSPAASRASSPPVCATPTAWRSSRQPARFGPS